MKYQRSLFVLFAVALFSWVIVCIFPRASSSHAMAGQTQRTVYLVIQVFDPNGDPVSGAHVNVYQEHRRGSWLAARPPDYQGETDSRGMIRFTIIGKKGENLLLSIEAERDGVGRRRLDDLDFTNSAIRPPIQKIDLKAQGQSESIDVRFKVHDDDSNDLADAKVTVVDPLLGDGAIGQSLGGVSSGTTQSDGTVVIRVPIRHNANIYHTDFKVTVTKDGYKSSGRTLTLYEKDIGTAVDAGELAIKKDKSKRDVVVTINVTSNGGPVPDAKVELAGPGNYSETTDASGTAVVHVQEIGTFSVSVSQDYYEPGGGSIRILEGDTAKAESYSLPAKEKKRTEPRDTINVTVLWKDPSDQNSKPAPLPREAEVSDGRVGTPTDGAGHAVLKGDYDVQQDVTVQASGFKPQSKSVRLNKSDPGAEGNGSITFILEPDLENTPLHLVVQVLDATTPNGPVRDANVLIRLNRKIIAQENTNSQGEATFTLTDTAEAPLSKIRAGLRLDVGKEKYKIKYSDITPDLLRPSLQAMRPTVFLERDWDALRAAINGLEPRVMAWKAEGGRTPAGKVAAAVASAEAAQQRAAQLGRQIDDLPNLNDSLAPGGRYRNAAKLQQDIHAAERDANQKAQQIETFVGDALGIKCATAADAEAITAKYRAAARLHLEIAALSKRAKADRDELEKLQKESTANKQKLADLSGQVGEIEQALATATRAQTDAEAAENESSLAQNSRAAKQTQLVAELSVLKTKFETDADPQVPADLKNRLYLMGEVLTSWKQEMGGGGRLDDGDFAKIRTAISAIQMAKAKADKRLAGFQRLSNDIDTLQTTVEGIDTTFSYAQLEISQAAKQSEDCASKTADGATRSSDETPKVEDIPDALDPGKIQPGKPPTTTDVTNPASRGETGSGNKPTKPVVEEIPDALDPGKPKSGTGGTNVATNRPGSRTTKPPAVEEIPDALDPGTRTPTTTGNRSGSNPTTDNRAASNNTSENKPPPGTKLSKDGKLQPKDGYVWVNPDDPNDTRVKKKPRDPNKPSIWEVLGGGIRAAMDPNNQGAGGNAPRTEPPQSGGTEGRTGGGRTSTPPPNNPSTSNSPPAKCTTSKVDPAGTWIITTDEDTSRLVLSRVSSNDWQGDPVILRTRTPGWKPGDVGDRVYMRYDRAGCLETRILGDYWETVQYTGSTVVLSSSGNGSLRAVRQ